VFVRDRVTGVTIRASISSSGKQGNDHPDYPFHASATMTR
jgi:hypothetical protein